MGKTSTKIIVALAAAFVLVAVFQAGQKNGSDLAEFQAQLLFPELDLAAVASVQIENADATLTLRRTEASGWGVEQRAGYPVDGEKLRRLGLAIVQLQPRDRLTDNPDKYATLGLGDQPEGGTVRFQDADGTALAVLRLGQRKQAKGPGGSSGQFVRAGDDPAVYLVAAAPAADTGATTWLERELLNLAADQVVAVSVERKAGGFTASRKQPSDPLTLETPLPAGRSADSGALGDLGRALVNLSCDEVLAPDDPATTELAFDVTFFARTADNLRYAVALTERDGTHYARLQAAALPAEPEAEAALSSAGGEKSEATPTKPDPAASAEAFNTRHQSWTYTIPQHTYDRLSKTLDNLLTDQKP